jgi:hypothetical protein
MRPSCSNKFECRPCGDDKHERTEVSGRLLMCKLCRAQVVIGSCCDRGQVYCSGECAQNARRLSQREAGKRYQASPKGRLAGAARQGKHRKKQRCMTTTQQVRPAAAVSARVIGSHGDSEHAKWRARQLHTKQSDTSHKTNKVTHHPSLLPAANDFVSLDEAATRLSRCHWCGRRCSSFVRTGFLRR